MISQNVRESEEKELIRFICFKYARFNLLAILKHMGYKGFLEFLDVFAGSYIKVPPTGKVTNLLERYRLYRCWLRTKEAIKNKDLTALHLAEQQFANLCAKNGFKNVKQGRKACYLIQKEFVEADKWYRKLMAVEAKQS